MDCKYSEKEEVSSNGRHYLICNITKQRCSTVRYCAKVGDIINTDNYDKNCVVYKEKASNVGKTDQLTNKVNKDIMCVLPSYTQIGYLLFKDRDMQIEEYYTLKIKLPRA